jgi:hypothetical protein
MNMDSIVSVYSDTRTEYTKQLCIFLVPAYFQFFVDLLQKAKETAEPKRLLWQLQTYLNEIHDWNMEKVHNEINLIHVNTGCDYLEDLLTAVFIAHTKVLTAIRLSANNKKVEITIPKVEHFLFKVLCEISKLLWSSTYLFRDDISGIDRQQNYKSIEGIIGEGILQAIRSLVPIKSILRNLVNQEDKEKEDKEDGDKEEDSDEEVMTLKKSSIDVKIAPKAILAPLEPLAPLAPLEEVSVPQEPSAESVSQEPLETITLEPKESLHGVLKHTMNKVLDVIQSPEASPPIIVLDKPSVSFAKFNSLFSSEDPEQSNMIGAGEDESPDLEILDGVGTSLSGGDFDSLDDATDEAVDDYEEL